jgi:hypothetical protein
MLVIIFWCQHLLQGVSKMGHIQPQSQSRPQSQRLAKALNPWLNCAAEGPAIQAAKEKKRLIRGNF